MDHRLITWVEADFAGDTRRFQLTRGGINELQQICNAGIGGIFKRVRNEDYTQADIRETIRLGLIGGGMDPASALALVRAAVDDQPLGPNVLLAALILHAINNGLEMPEGAASKKAPAATAMTAGSTSPPETDLPPPPSDGRLQ
jgi:Phage tail tube protein, GTA-gp10